MYGMWMSPDSIGPDLLTLLDFVVQCSGTTAVGWNSSTRNGRDRYDAKKMS
jgi:hypothetical protein